MNDDLVRLLENATENPDAFWPLVDALRAAAERDAVVLVEFARAASRVQRRAAAAAGAGREVAALGELAYDPENEVRQELAFALKNFPHWPGMDATVETLLLDTQSGIRQTAAWACQHRSALWPLLCRR